MTRLKPAQLARFHVEQQVQQGLSTPISTSSSSTGLTYRAGALSTPLSSMATGHKRRLDSGSETDEAKVNEGLELVLGEGRKSPVPAHMEGGNAIGNQSV